MSPSASSLTMKPKPRVASNHLTVPVSWSSASSSSRGAAPSLALGERGSAPRQRASPTRRHLRPIPLDQTVELSWLSTICEPCAVQSLSASGISPGRAADDAPREVRADGRREASPRTPFRAPARSASAAANGPDPAPLGEAQRRVPGAVRGASRAPRRHPPRRSRPRAAPRRPAARHSRAGQRGGAGGGEGAVVDIAQRRHPLDQRARPAARPAPSQPRSRSLRLEIGGEPGAGRRIAPGIGKRGLFERLRVERRPRLSVTDRASPPCLCHSRAGL